MQKDFLLAIWASVKAGTQIFNYAFKLKSSLILNLTVFGAQPSSLDFFSGRLSHIVLAYVSMDFGNKLLCSHSSRSTRRDSG